MTDRDTKTHNALAIFCLNGDRATCATGCNGINDARDHGQLHFLIPPATREFAPDFLHELGKGGVVDGEFHLDGFLANYSFSKPWLVNFRVRLFSVTVRTSWSDAPCGSLASISMVTVTSEPG